MTRKRSLAARVSLLQCKTNTSAMTAGVKCHVEGVELDGDYGLVDSTRVTCRRCGRVAEAFGTSGSSVRRCFVMLGKECGEANWYVDEAQQQD